MDDLVFNINMLLVVIAIIAVFIIFVFRKKVKIAIKNNNDNNVKKYIVFAIKYCSKREKFLCVKRLREIVEDVYLNNMEEEIHELLVNKELENKDINI